MGDIAEEDIDLLDFFSASEVRSSSPTNALPKAQQATPVTGNTKRVSQEQAASSKPRAAFGDSSSPHTGSASPRSTKAPLFPLADFAEAYSGLRVRNRLLSAEDMRLRMKGRKVHRLAELRSAPTQALESQDPSDAWAAVGVLVSKSPRRQAANGGSYAIWTLSDLSRKENDISVFLFQEALGSHWTVCEGTLLAVLSAKVLPPKGAGGGGGGGGDQRLAFSVDSPWQVSRVGMAMDYALCKGKRKDGKPCTMPVNKTEGGGFCEFHVVAAFNRAQRQDPLRAKAKGNGNGTGTSGGNNNFRAMMQGKNAAPGRQHQNPILGRATSTPASTRTGPASCMATPRRAPTISLSGIMGDGARRREDIGAARFGGSGGANLRPPTKDAKPLRPSATRAAGRTTMLSALSAACGGASASRPSSGLRENRPRGSGATATPTSSTPSASGNARASAGRGNGGGSSSNSGGGASEDLMGLPWAYGNTEASGQGAATKIPKRRTGNGEGSGGGGGGGGTGHGKNKRRRDCPPAAGGEGGGADDGERKAALAARPPAEAHPAGYMDGTVVVPAPSSVFLTMGQRCGVRGDGTRTHDGEKKLDEVKMLMNQRIIKQKADAQGIILRPQDPNASVGGSTNRPSILGAGKKNARPGAASADALLGARGGAGGKVSDPFAKKVKTMSAVEKEVLLRRVSKYAGLAEEERAKDADRSMQRLENREAMADKAEEVTKMAVTVYHCKECKMRRTHFSKRCKDLGHQQKGVKGILRFFECTNCRRRRSSTERMPQTGCEGCGTHNAWKRCGARPGRGPADGPRDKRFVAAMSEWTDRRDLSLAGPDFR